MATVRGLTGEDEGDVDLPIQFQERVRPDIIKKAVLSAQSKRQQPHGADPRAGLKHVTHWKKRSRAYRGIRGRGYPSSRTPRKITMRRGSQLSGPGGEAPQTPGGRRAHPPKAEKNPGKDINTKERRKGIRSAIAATADPDTVRERGHRLPEDVDLPIVVNDEVEEMERTVEVEDLLHMLGLEEELARIREPQSRAGRGTMRGRRTRQKTGPLVVVSEDQGISRAARNIPGVDVSTVEDLNAELLAPGTDPGRLVIWSENAIQELGSAELFR